MIVRACDQCFSIKQKCDGKDPCVRCSRLGLECAYLRSRQKRDRYDKTYDRDGEVAAEQPRKKYRAAMIKRQRTGCDNCKKRKKKCDEAEGQCSDCRRLQLPCIRSRKPSQQLSASPASIRESNADSPGITHLSGQDHVVSQRTPSASISSNPSPMSMVPLDIAGLDPDDASPQASPVYHWLALENLSALADAEVDFDIIQELNPENDDSECLVFDTIAEPDFLFDNSGPEKLTWVPLDPMTIPYGLTSSPVDQLTNRHDKHLFQHYTHIVSRSLCIASDDTDNPFIRLMIPLAVASPAVMGAILTLSAIHLKHNGGYPDIVQRGINLQTKALTALNSLIASASSTSFFREQVLACILLFCIIDVREGNSLRWDWHITGAKTVITSADQMYGRPLLDTSSWYFLLDVFEYVDSVITISKCQPPLINHEKLRPADDYLSMDSPTTSSSLPSSLSYRSNAIFGVARPIFRLIGQVSALSSRRKDRIKPHFDAKFRKTAKVIEGELRAWNPPNISDTSSSAFSSSSSRTVHDRDLEDAAHAALALKWASILRLHQIVEGYAIPHPVPGECLENILIQLQHIHVRSAVESQLVFPLIMAASVALSEHDRMTIRSRWLIIERTIGFGNIAKGGKMLEEIWEAMDKEMKEGVGEPGRVNVNWASIRWHDYGSLVMF